MPINSSPTTKHRFNFRELELKLQTSYNEFIKDFNNQENFSNIFYDVKNLAFGILTVGKIWVNYEVDYDSVAYEYSTHLIERIITGKFVVNPDRYDKDNKFGWHNYIRLNIRDIIGRKFASPDNTSNISIDELKEVYEDVANHDAHLVDSDICDEIEIETHNKFVASKCSKYLKMIYGDRYYILTSKFLSLEVYNVDDITDEELKEFVKISLVLFKRLYESYNLTDVCISNVRKVFNSTLYLASILSNEEDKRLYISLDLANLYRLALSNGGETIRVPTVEELDELIGTAKISYEILAANLSDKKKIRKLRDRVREDYGVFVRFDKLNANVRNLFMYMSSEINEGGPIDDTPMIKSLITLTNRSDAIINNLLDKIERSVSEIEDKDELIAIYREMINNLMLSCNMVTNIRNMASSVYSKDQ